MSVTPPAILPALRAVTLFALFASMAWLGHAEPVEQAWSGERLALQGTVEWIEDPQRTWTVDEARRQPGWTVPRALNPGFSRSAWWLRMRLRNAEPEARDAVLDLRQPLQDEARWFVLDTAGRLRAEHASGDRLRWSQRPLPTRSLAVPLRLGPGEAVDVYVRLDTDDGLFETLRPQLVERTRFLIEDGRETLLQGLYFGSLLALALYNLLIFASTRGKAFGCYGIYLLAFLLWSFCYRGFGSQQLWPDTPAVAHAMLAVGAVLSLSLFVAFSIVYTDMVRRAPRWQSGWLGALAVSLLLAVPVALLDHYALAFAIIVPLGLVLMASSLATGWGMWRRGSRESGYVLLAFCCVAVGIGANLLEILDVVRASALTEWLWQIGSAAQALLLALGLADSMNRLKAEKLYAETQARQAQALLATSLESQVRDRTVALEAANQRLNELSVTDELTGVFNRRSFNECCRNLLLGHAPGGGALALCMFDIDHFKAFNDRYGHQAGDHALRDVAQAVRRRMRRSSDRVFRLGGEEFGVLLEADDPVAGIEIVQGLRMAVRELGRAHLGNPAGIVTASFGVAWFGAEALRAATPETLYAEADALLYQAKRQGRDRIVAATIAANAVGSAAHLDVGAALRADPVAAPARLSSA